MNINRLSCNHLINIGIRVPAAKDSFSVFRTPSCHLSPGDRLDILFSGCAGSIMVLPTGMSRWKVGTWARDWRLE